MRYFLLLVLAGLLNGCSEMAPEEQLAEYIAQAVEYAEKKDSRGLKKLVSPDYADARDLRRADIIRIAAGYFMRKPALHIQTKTVTITLSDNEQSAEVDLIAAISQVVLDDEMQLLRADFHRFKCWLKHDGDWLLHSVEWQPSSVEQFLNH